MITIYAITIPPGADKADFEGLLPLLAPDKRRRIERLSRAALVVQSLYGELLARMAIAMRLKMPLRAIRFHCGGCGKPEITVGGGLRFNVGHSLDRVVCATSDMEVGVDVETIRSVKLDIIRHFLTADECANILSVPEAERSRRLFQIWTLKESYLKAVGSGLTIPLNSFAMQVQGKSIAIRASAEALAVYGFRSWLWDDVCWISLCALERPLPAAFKVIHSDSLRHAMASLDSDAPFRLSE